MSDQGSRHCTLKRGWWLCFFSILTTIPAIHTQWSRNLVMVFTRRNPEKVTFYRVWACTPWTLGRVSFHSLLFCQTCYKLVLRKFSCSTLRRTLMVFDNDIVDRPERSVGHGTSSLKRKLLSELLSLEWPIWFVNKSVKPDFLRGDLQDFATQQKKATFSYFNGRFGVLVADWRIVANGFLECENHFILSYVGNKAPLNNIMDNTVIENQLEQCWY